MCVYIFILREASREVFHLWDIMPRCSMLVHRGKDTLLAALTYERTGCFTLSRSHATSSERFSARLILLSCDSDADLRYVPGAVTLPGD